MVHMIYVLCFRLFTHIVDFYIVVQALLLHVNIHTVHVFSCVNCRVPWFIITVDLTLFLRLFFSHAGHGSVFRFFSFTGSYFVHVISCMFT